MYFDNNKGLIKEDNDLEWTPINKNLDEIITKLKQKNEYLKKQTHTREFTRLEDEQYLS